MCHAHAFSNLVLHLLVSERRGHRNERRKEAAKKATQVSVRRCTDTVSTLPLSLPLSLYTDGTIFDLSVLSRRLFWIESINEGWFILFLCSLFYIYFRVD